MSNATNSSNPWAPPGVTPDEFAIDHANFRGLIVIAVAYGYFLCIATAALYFLIVKPLGGKRHWGQIAYVLALLAGGTIYLGPQTKWIELMFIDDSGFPGDPADGIPAGPVGFFFTQTGAPSVVLSTVAYVIDNFLADAMMLYRAALVWNYNWLVIVIPGLWLIASTVLSILLLIEAADPAVPFPTDFALSYFPLSMTLNIVLGLLVVGKLLWVRRKLGGAMGKQHGKVYGSMASLIVESSALYWVVSLIYISLYGANKSNAASEVLGLLGEVMCISPVLIILRIAYGQGISRDVVLATSNAMELTTTRAPGADTEAAAADPDLKRANSDATTA